ncbi:uncharacterized protein LOC106670821 isoform X3 [Cimex lectularius]|uniref:SH3 and cysteine-rich domain-containing protein 3 n=1 Tax=Cimex lectularius TaxID=79782 RepID=A0A8I6S6C6_CIMLE|nr:uncharacterized protein LOC106670821 isoform X3 [Cimex lectularius]
MYIIYPAQEVIQYTLPSSSTHNLTSYYAGRYGGYTRTMESLKGMAHPAVWSNVKNHITTSLAVVKNLSDFAQELSQMYEHHAEELQLLVGNYRKKNAELRKDGSRGSNSMIQLWEGLLQEVEADSQAHGEIASVLGHQVSRHTLERTFYRKVQARKILAHRESLDSVIAKSEETLSKCRQEYKAAYLSHIQAPMSNTSLSEYLDAHNTYVTQLHATNAMVDTYCRETLPELLTELEEVYNDLCTTLSEAIAQGAEIISNRAGAQSRRYCTIWGDSKAVDPTSDTAALVRNSAVPSQPHPTHRLRLFTPPHSEDQEGAVAQLKNTLVVDRPASIQVQSTFESLNSEADGLQAQIQHLQDSLSTMLRIQQRSIESSLFNKANEIQEDISMKRYELKTAQINLAGVKAKKELFALKMEGDGGGGSDRKMSTASTASMKSKWLKAFKSLKTPPLSNGKEAEKEKKHQMYHAVSTIIAMRRNGKDVQLAGGENAHQFQEYTYKKITPCDVCSQVLRGHTKQGLKCRLCKMNVHLDCQERVGKCQTKSRLLRRQKSSSDIETRATPPDEEGLLAGRMLRPGRSVSPGGASSPSSPDRSPIGRSVTFRTPDQIGGLQTPQPVPAERDPQDSTYQVLKTANEISSTRASEPRTTRRPNPSHAQHHHHHQSASSAPHSPRRQKLNLRMKSLSLDSPESTEHNQRRRPGTNCSAQTSAHGSSHSSSSRLQSPSSPVHSRRLLSARNMRMSSVELPDDNEKSISSASTSPCPSPKPYRLLPNNLYVVLYNFKSRHSDELDLKAGYKLTVIDTSDPDWWRGKCLGRVGYFPSKYVAKVQPGERALQVTHNLQVADSTLLRDQIVIQIGEEVDGMVMIRSGDNRQGICPIKYLTEV